MNVKLATQIFSHSMASALRTCISAAELKSKTASDTAETYSVTIHIIVH